MRGQESAISVNVHDLRVEVSFLKEEAARAESSVMRMEAARDANAVRERETRCLVESGEREMEAFTSITTAFWQEKTRNIHTLQTTISKVQSVDSRRN